MGQDEELKSFPYEATVGGHTHFYRITHALGSYGIEQDGVVVAELKNDGQWQQLSGEPLHPEVFASICSHIESRNRNSVPCE